MMLLSTRTFPRRRRANRFRRTLLEPKVALAVAVLRPVERRADRLKPRPIRKH